MSIHAFFLEHKERIGGPQMELAIFEHDGPASRLAVFDGEHLLLECVYIFGREKEDALVEVEYFGISAATYPLHLLAP